MIKAAIFDLDGLLIDTEPIWRAAHRSIVAGYGGSLTENEVREMAGKPTLDIAREWCRRFDLQIAPVELANKIAARVVAEVNRTGRPLPGALQSVQLFQNHAIPIALASSAAPSVIEAALHCLGLEDIMSYVRSGTSVARGKPYPDLFLATAEDLGVNAKNCLVFEDSASGVQAAKAAGMKCIVVPEEKNRHLKVFRQADRILSSLLELKWEYIEQM
jgi:mannitol-1-/sugar-/sorbitol-6-/2-deoxyglucose-6-phosphatase